MMVKRDELVGGFVDGLAAELVDRVDPALPDIAIFGPVAGGDGAGVQDAEQQVELAHLEPPDVVQRCLAVAAAQQLRKLAIVDLMLQIGLGLDRARDDVGDLDRPRRIAHEVVIAGDGDDLLGADAQFGLQRPEFGQDMAPDPRLPPPWVMKSPVTTTTAIWSLRPIRSRSATKH